MNLKGICADAVRTAFQTVGLSSEAGSITRSCVFHSVIPGTYVPDNGTDPATTATTTVEVIFTRLSQREVDGQRVRVGDKKAVIQRGTDTGYLATEPKREDYLMDGSVKLEVVEIFSEPSESVWLLAVREVKT